MGRLFLLLLLSLVLCGCYPPKKPQPKFSNKGKTETGIFGKKTQDIDEYDPEKDKKVEDGMVAPNPVNPLGALKAYGPTTKKIAELGVKKAIDLFHAAKGRYPKNHEEFMEEVIKANRIELPVLPGGREYRYDVKNHELVVVEKQEKSDK